MSGFAFIVAGGKARPAEPKEALGADGELVWIHLNTNNDEAKTWLTEQAKLSEYVIDALTAMETRPRCDAAGDGALVNLRGLSSERLAASDPLASVRIFARLSHILSVSRKPLNAIETVCGLVRAGHIQDPGDLISELATAITSELDPVVAELGDSLDLCEERISADNAFSLRRLVNHVRIQAIGYRRFLSPQRTALEKLAALPGDWLNDDDRLHLVAAADRAARMAEELESIRERAALVHETLTDLRAEQIDQRSLVIAIAAMVFLPITFITGLYGMNVDGLPFAHEPWSFDAIFGVCVLISLGVTLYFVRRRWVGRTETEAPLDANAPIEPDPRDPAKLKPTL